MVIGNHILEGSVQDLPKPLILAQPTEESEPFRGSENLHSSICKVRGVIRQKILFKSRPRVEVGALYRDDPTRAQIRS